MNPPSTHPLGVLLAVIFLVSMVSLQWWMFHLPPVVSYEVAHVTGMVRTIHRIMVPVVNEEYSIRAIELAARIGSEQKAEIILLYVLEVPLTFPLGVALPEAEKKAEELLTQLSQ